MKSRDNACILVSMILKGGPEIVAVASRAWILCQSKNQKNWMSVLILLYICSLEYIQYQDVFFLFKKEKNVLDMSLQRPTVCRTTGRSWLQSHPGDLKTIEHRPLGTFWLLSLQMSSFFSSCSRLWKMPFIAYNPAFVSVNSY